MSKLETNTIDTVSGTNTLQVGDGNVATINLGKSGDTINIPSGATIANSGTATGFGANTPSFSAYDANAQTIPNTTYTLLEFDTESFDTDSAYNTSNYKFTVPSGKGGKYLIGCAVKTTAAADRVILRLEKNDANTFYSETNSDSNGSCQFNLLMDLSATDHLKVAIYQNSGGNLNLEGGSGTNAFYGYKLT